MSVTAAAGPGFIGSGSDFHLVSIIQDSLVLESGEFAIAEPCLNGSAAAAERAGAVNCSACPLLCPSLAEEEAAALERARKLAISISVIMGAGAWATTVPSRIESSRNRRRTAYGTFSTFPRSLPRPVWFYPRS